ncbi:flippase-like domain-containing protein [Microvirga sp. HBU67558]|uniref:lysylphosphatidylglycerol synthase transmembrane domain-containing protein n=1 Tax=Microvirga TaxID=186650 RepID=UPI001B37DBC4|nr:MULTISPECIES: lysylphosphatidylglycerol synthase transmembrane domain-containing protein [unclassified Microvirga]MBQ0823536.1 flippase-like domain-containing protein [Microvirga sp. HBU67558]
MNPFQKFRLPESRSRRSKSFLVLAKVVVSTAILIFLGRNLEIAAIERTFRTMTVEMFGLCLLQLLLIPVLGAIRWKIVLSRLGYALRLRPLGRIFWIGMALNQILPTAVGGDAIRTWMIYRDGVNPVDATISVLLERIALLGSLLTMICMAGWIGSTFVPHALFKLTGLAVLAGIVAVALLPFGERLFALLPNSRFVRLGHSMWCSLSKVMLNYWALPLGVLCILTNLNFAIAGWWLGLAMNLPFDGAVYLVAIPVVTLATVIPISVGGWGVREAAMVGMLGPLAGNDVALLYSVMFGIALLLSSLPGLILLLWNPAVAHNPNVTASPALRGSK